MERAHRVAKPSQQHQGNRRANWEAGISQRARGQRPEGGSIKMPGMELEQMESRKDKMEVGQRKYVGGVKWGLLR